MLKFGVLDISRTKSVFLMSVIKHLCNLTRNEKYFVSKLLTLENRNIKVISAPSKPSFIILKRMFIYVNYFVDNRTTLLIEF